MLQFEFHLVKVTKLYPLAISRGVMTESENLFVTVTDGVHTGVGEHSPATGSNWTAPRGKEQLEAFANAGHAPALYYNLASDSFTPLESTGLPLGMPMSAVPAIDSQASVKRQPSDGSFLP